jgi:CubicO group peptidase (beta-lactamase class C family)
MGAFAFGFSGAVGGWLGFSTYVGLCPDRKIGVVYMTNCDYPNYGRIIDMLLSTALGREKGK